MTEGYYYTTQKDIFEWETKMKFKNHLTYYKPTEKSKTMLEKSVQCRGISGDPFPVSHSRRCLNKTKNPNGLCHFHQDPNVSVKYWKN